MSDLDYDAMRKVAEAATQYSWTASAPGEVWKHYGGTVEAVGFPDDFDPGICDALDNTDAQHIATFDPPTVLRLLDLAQRAEADRAAVERVRGLLSESCHHCGRTPEADGDHTCLCPNPDSECLQHTFDPVVSLADLRAALDRKEDQ